MKLTTSLTVTPEPLDPSSVRGVGSPELGYWGCLAPVLALIAAAIIGAFTPWEPWWLNLVPAVALVGWLLYLDVERQNRRLKSEYQDRLQRHRESLARQAVSAKERLMSSLKEGEELTAALRLNLENADQALQQADFEFGERAFGPFWDAVELAALEIGNYRENINKISRTAGLYQKWLSEVRHTFPPWHEAIVPLGPPTNTLARFQTTVRRGQTDYEFSSILEQRLTREVLIKGFKHFGEVLADLHRTVESEFAETKRKIDSLSIGSQT